jgi:hypothetical protein
MFLRDGSAEAWNANPPPGRMRSPFPHFPQPVLAIPNFGEDRPSVSRAALMGRQAIETGIESRGSGKERNTTT